MDININRVISAVFVGSLGIFALAGVIALGSIC